MTTDITENNLDCAIPPKLCPTKCDLIVPFTESKYLLLSSCFFVYPSYIAYNRGNNIHSAIIFMIFLFSVNYWRNPTYGWRRNLDLIWAKSTFVIYGSYGLYYIREPYTYYIFCQNMILIMLCYYLSCKHYKRNEKIWLLYHILLHYYSSYDIALDMLQEI